MLSAVTRVGYNVGRHMHRLLRTLMIAQRSGQNSLHCPIPRPDFVVVFFVSCLKLKHTYITLPDLCHHLQDSLPRTSTWQTYMGKQWLAEGLDVAVGFGGISHKGRTGVNDNTWTAAPFPPGYTCLTHLAPQ